MKIKLLFILTFLSFFCLVSCKNENTKQFNEKGLIIDLNYSFISNDSIFKVRFPDKPEIFVDSLKEDGYDLLLTFYEFNYEENVIFLISVTEYLNLKEQLDVKSVLTSSVQGFVEEIGLNIETLKLVKHSNYQGVEFIASGKGYTAHLRNFLSNNKLFQIGVVFSSDYYNQTNSLNFIESFDLIKAKYN